MLAARRAGIRSLLVLTGVADHALAAGLEGDSRPDWIAEGPAEVARGAYANLHFKGSCLALAIIYFG